MSVLDHNLSKGLLSSCNLFLEGILTMLVDIKSTLFGIFKEKIPNLKIRMKACYFGAEVLDLSLSRPLEEGLVREIKSALDVFGVLVFKNQVLSNREQLGFAEQLSDCLHRKTGVSTIAANRYGDEALTDVSNLGPDGRVLAVDDRRRQYGLSNRLWHTDASFQDPPGRYSMLSAKIVPKDGGETEFANTRDAYYMLPKKTKDRICGLKAHHSIAYSREILGFEFSLEEADRLKGVRQPLVRENSRTNLRSLYIASHCSSIVGLSSPDGRILIRDLIDHCTQESLIYRHSWQKDDFVIWDNFATMHRGLAYDDLVSPRELVRVTTLEEQ